MTKIELEKSYFEWMCDKVYDSHSTKNMSFSKLLRQLHRTNFYYILDMDGNRASDGIELRYTFGYERGILQPIIASYLDDRPCSMLEMLVALSQRVEDSIMFNSSIGNRVGQWFWNMIVNLGLGSMTDSRYDEEYVDRILTRFMNREYERNGAGGLVTVDNCRNDLRNVEIWYQIMWYLNQE